MRLSTQEADKYLLKYLPSSCYLPGTGQKLPFTLRAILRKELSWLLYRQVN
jgi:hypothetical protein